MAAPTEKFLSILIPTRTRFDKLLNCIAKQLEQIPVESHGRIEYIIKFDSDDLDSIKRIPELPFDRVDTHVYIADRLNGYRDLYIFYNQCARLSRGQLIMLWNDDAQFKTADWFPILVNECRVAPAARSYWFGGTPTRVKREDGSFGTEDWPCFIAHHRLLYEIMGIYSHVGGVDSFLYYVLGPLGLLHKLDSIQVDHTAWFDIPPGERDDVSHHNSAEGQMLPTDFSVVQRCQERIRAFASRQPQSQQAG